MATVETVKQIVGFLAEVTGKTVTPALFSLWEYSFEEADDDELKKAAYEYVESNRFFPTPMELRAIMGQTPRSRGLAWARISGFLTGKIKWAELDDISKKMIDLLGGSKYVRENPLKDTKITFFQLYDDVAAGEYAKEVRERLTLKAPALISGLLEVKDESE